MSLMIRYFGVQIAMWYRVLFVPVLVLVFVFVFMLMTRCNLCTVADPHFDTGVSSGSPKVTGETDRLAVDVT